MGAAGALSGRFAECPLLACGSGRLLMLPHVLEQQSAELFGRSGAWATDGRGFPRGLGRSCGRIEDQAGDGRPETSGSAQAPIRRGRRLRHCRLEAGGGGFAQAGASAESPWVPSACRSPIGGALQRDGASRNRGRGPAHLYSVGSSGPHTDSVSFPDIRKETGYTFISRNPSFLLRSSARPLGRISLRFRRESIGVRSSYLRRCRHSPFALATL